MREPIVKRLAILAVGALAVAGLVTSSLGQAKPRQKAIYTVTTKNSPIQTAADLRGKTIGVSALSSGAVPVARAIVSSGGLNPDADVKWLAVGIGGPAALALRQKNIDAMALWGDFQAGLENLGLQ